jgi:Uma2 family endonuclease
LHLATDDGIVVVKNVRTAMTPAPSLMTVDDYFTKTPETVTPMELAYGVLRVAESPTPRHQSAVLQLLLALDRHVRERQLGRMWVAPLDVVLDEPRALIVQPDLFFISNDRSFIVGDRVRGAPDLVIEVLSPDPRIGQTDERVRWFMTNRVRECWLIHQDQRSVSVIQFADGQIASRTAFTRLARIESAVLPDFALSLDDILD